MLWEDLRRYAGAGVLPMHMPGHKRNGGAYPWLAALGCAMDLTEIDGFDNLNDPQTIFRALEQRAARQWGAKESVCLVNGSTGGLLAAVRAVLEGGGALLMSRGAHRSVYHAAELVQADTYYLSAPVDSQTGILGTPTAGQVEAALAAHPDIRLVCLTSPTYEGMICDIRAAAEACHRRNVPLLVDEAHGAHLGLSGFPLNAVRLGADLSVQSLHKTLPSLTQTAILHISGNLVDPGAVRRNAAMLQTSSPSYLLTASIEGCVDYLAREGDAAADRWLACLNRFYQDTADLRALRILGPEQRFAGRFAYARDPSKILILAASSGMTGMELMNALRAESRIELEMAAANYALAMTGMGDGPESLARLAQALHDLDAACLEKMKSAAHPDPEGPRPIRPGPPLPEQRAPLHAAVIAQGAFCPAQEALGRVSGEYIWAYPPGIPLLAPGEIVDQNVLAALRANVRWHSSRGRAPEQIFCLLHDPGRGGKICDSNIDRMQKIVYNREEFSGKGDVGPMKRIQTIDTRDLKESAVNGGCGECQTSCQSACKTSCGVANQVCEHKEAKE